MNGKIVTVILKYVNIIRGNRKLYTYVTPYSVRGIVQCMKCMNSQ